MTARQSRSSRKSSVIDDVLGLSGSEGTTSLAKRASEFLKNYYRPIAVLLAMVILAGAAFYIYDRIKTRNMQLAAQMLDDAKSYEDLQNPELVQKVKGTPLEYDWYVKKLEKLQFRKKPGTGTLDLEGYIEEAEKFLDKYPNTAMAPVIRFNVATYYAYLAEFDKAVAEYEKMASHPKARFFKQRAEEELKKLKDYRTDPDLDENFKKAFEEYAKSRLATPTPTPSPSPSASPSAAPSVAPTVLPSPVKLPGASAAPASPAASPAASPSAPAASPAAPAASAAPPSAPAASPAPAGGGAR